MLFNDSNRYLAAMQATPVPPAYQAARRDTIAGVRRFRDGGAHLRDGIAAGDTKLIAQSQLLQEQGANLFVQASLNCPPSSNTVRQEKGASRPGQTAGGGARAAVCRAQPGA